MNADAQRLKDLAAHQLSTQVIRVDSLQAHASARRIYRLWMSDGSSTIGVVNDCLAENAAFIGFSHSFHAIGLRVPSILASDHTTAYITCDFGDTTLMDVIVSARKTNSFETRVIPLYKKSIEQLLAFQTQGLDAIDQTLCYQGAVFNGAAIAEDVHFFCRQYLARVNLWSATDDVTDDIAELVQVCAGFDRGYFMYRDFQSRNIMVDQQSLYFIDYQSGREGPLQYDLASLLFQSKANLSDTMRDMLLEYYLSAAEHLIDLDHDRFKALYRVFVLVRALQTLGVYGELGLGQHKAYFKSSIPFALQNCRSILKHWPKILKCPSLRHKLERAVEL